MESLNKLVNSNNKSEGNVAVILTGGTIICSYDADTKLSTPSLHINDLLYRLPKSAFCGEIHAEELFYMQGTELTLEHGLAIACRLRSLLEDPAICGAVVLQGTDTLDEIAYLCSLLIGTNAEDSAKATSSFPWYQKPVVFTGAMKSNNELCSDGISNLAGALKVASSKEASGKGVLVYMNQQILSARDVEKTHSNRIDAFSSVCGPLGTVENNIVRFFRSPVTEKTFPELLTMPSSADLLPQDIYILKSYAGMDDRLLRACVSFPAKGIIIEGLGAGNVQPPVVPALTDAIAKGIPVIITSRCFGGAAFGTYDYTGGGADLLKRGAIFACGLSSQKARIKLSVLIAAGVEPDALSSYFQ